MIEFTIALLVAVVLAAAIMGGLALYGSLSSHEKRSPATNTVAGDNLSPSPTSTTRILNVSGAWGYVKPLIKWLTIITIVTLVAVVVFAFVKWEAPNTTDVTATTSSAFPYFNISDLFTAELLLIGVVVLALASILLLFRRAGSVTSVFGRDLIFLVIVGVMIYTLYHYQLLKTPVFWFVVAMLLLVLWLVSKNLRFRLVMFFAFLILAAIFFQQGIEHGITWLDRGINHREWLTPTMPTNTRSVIDQPVVIQARASGQIIAPVGKWSDWISFPTDKCAYAWGEDPNGSRFVSRFLDRKGEIWTNNDSSGYYVAARSYRSTTERPERVSYQLVDRRPDGSCEQM
ncbi:hypothetical protein A2392_02840 [Candidatus Kaiserbacteria bacterium RIFOXYB1_FULL_46_14]|uniref:Uncharacterized protein n=1 Tax=Candidatus Kaiserbacteria bacterium RIFOXYB1_FULL_46_14 TaxID=1798531 RepID=A0A1F6FIM6_9BACT|nr:MAG: hypothetical protein A2392_02840 [Candidatus Kaiserbacteria bacterium RIFOXYB1_FULL_46_14]